MVRGFVIILGVLGLLALTVELYARSRDRSHQQQLELAAERALLGGGLQGLLRARTLAMGSTAMAGDTEAAATLALASAMLVSEYGVDEANAALAAAQVVESSPDASPRAQALKLATRALVEITKGHADQAEAWARRSVDLGHKQASPLFALGRVRFHQGNLAAAAHAFQAALVREPAFVEARVAWAEVCLEQGDREKAKEALLTALQRTPDHSRARLLLAEIPSTSNQDSEWEAACARDGITSPVIADKCSLTRAQRAWHRENWNTAVDLAGMVGHRQPVEPRVLAGAAQLLACAGAVDKAIASMNAVARSAMPLPSLRWARVAIDLGRGQLVDIPKDLPPGSSPFAPLLAARVALALGGIKAFESAMSAVTGAAPTGDQRVPGDPVSAYVKGMQARLAGQTDRAADLLAQALARHGDACRAAGEYLAVGEALGRAPDTGALAWLLDNNSQCVNLPAVFAAVDHKKRSKSATRATRGSR